jgi:hypothetical protein
MWSITGGVGDGVHLGTMTLSEPRAQEPILGQPIELSASPDGQTLLEIYRNSDALLLRFPQLADFHIDNTQTQSVLCQPSPNISDDTILHLFRNHVEPLLWSRDGGLSLHASAAVVDNRAIAFSGSSGSGKSTLAAFIASSGSNALLTDDTLMLERNGNTFMALPGANYARLWVDSSSAIFGKTASPMPAFEHTSKGRFSSKDLFEQRNEAAPLECLFFLGDRNVTNVEINPLNGSDAFILCLGCSLMIDRADPTLISNQFALLLNLCSNVTLYSLDYPREYGLLTDILNAIEKKCPSAH